MRAGATLRKPGCKFALDPNVGSRRLEFGFGDFLTVLFLEFGSCDLVPDSRSPMRSLRSLRLLGRRFFPIQPQRTQGPQRSHVNPDSIDPLHRLHALWALFRPEKVPGRTKIGLFIHVTPSSPRQTCGSTPTLWFLELGSCDLVPDSRSPMRSLRSLRLLGRRFFPIQPQRTHGPQGSHANPDSITRCPGCPALKALFRPEKVPGRTNICRFINATPSSPGQTCGSTPAYLDRLLGSPFRAQNSAPKSQNRPFHPRNSFQP